MNTLRMYDFTINHKQYNNKCTFQNLVLEHEELIKHMPIIEGDDVSRNLDWPLLLAAFKLQFTNDLATEKLFDRKNKKLVKKGIQKRNGLVSYVDVLQDNDKELIYGTLLGGKITENSFLEKVDTDDETIQNLNGDRIYDEFFFMLHPSFRCNKARLFIITKASTTNPDSILKKYFEKFLFKSHNFNHCTTSHYIPQNIQKEVIERTVVTDILISKNEKYFSTGLQDNFKIELKLTSESKQPFSKIKQNVVDFFKKTKITFADNQENDDDGFVQFNITDPETNSSQKIALNNLDEFLPKLIFENIEILDNNMNIDIDKAKKICTNYIQYENDGLI